jgi:phosphatidylserine decarboxylase
VADKTLYSRLVVAEPGDPLGYVAALAYLLPKNLLSYVVGVLVRIRFPKPLSLWLCQGFAKVFRLNMAEAEASIDSFECIEDVFTRRLKAGVRTIDSAFCSPADGFLACSAAAVDDTAVQAKGITFSLSDLVLGETAESRQPETSLNLAWSVAVYLAPHNYHRVHSPVAGSLVAIRYLPGELWPVNNTFVRRIPRLFNRNERLVFDIALPDGGFVYLAMVGALNVGRIVSPFLPAEATNSLERQFIARPKTLRLPAPVVLEAGTEVGTFMLGSTVVLALDQIAAGRFPLVQATENRPILMGQSLLR